MTEIMPTAPRVIRGKVMPSSPEITSKLAGLFWWCHPSAWCRPKLLWRLSHSWNHVQCAGLFLPSCSRRYDRGHYKAQSANPLLQKWPYNADIYLLVRACYNMEQRREWHLLRWNRHFQCFHYGPGVVSAYAQQDRNSSVHPLDDHFLDFLFLFFSQSRSFCRGAEHT